MQLIVPQLNLFLEWVQNANKTPLKIKLQNLCASYLVPKQLGQTTTWQTFISAVILFMYHKMRNLTIHVQVKSNTEKKQKTTVVIGMKRKNENMKSNTWFHNKLSA